MTAFRHKLNGEIIEQPRNFDELEISKDFIGQKSYSKINIATLNFAGEIASKIKKRFEDGMTGGIGAFEGDRYDIELGNENNPEYIFRGYLDYSDNIEFTGCNEVKVALKSRFGDNWINDIADGFSFRYLFSKGVIKNSDFVKVPYTINYIPDGVQVLITTISLFIMGKEALERIKELQYALGDVIDAGTPIVGAGVGLGAVAVTGVDVGNFILVTIKLLALIAYTLLIIIAIKALIEELLKQFYEVKRYHLGMRLIDLFKKGCEHIGLTLKSDLLERRKEWVIIPQKNHKGGEAPSGVSNFVESGTPTANDPFDTFGDLIRVWKRNFNADYQINDGVFYFEREDFWQKRGDFIIKDYFTDQTTLKDTYKPNVNEIISNYNINWSIDSQDLNTLDNQEGRVFQAILEPRTKRNQDLVTLKNSEEVNIGCSMGLRKNDYTLVEVVLKEAVRFLDRLSSTVGIGTGLSRRIESRRGSLLLSSHFLTIPKIVVMSGDKLAREQRNLLSAKRLWGDFHYINSFAEINGIHNQYYRYEKVKVPFCLKDFVNLIGSNFCKTESGEDAEIESLSWKVWQDYAEVDYRVKKKYTNNLIVKYVE